MTNPFDPAIDSAQPPDLWITISQAVLVFCGACYMLLGLGMGVGFGWAMSMDPTIDPEIAAGFGLGFGLVMFLVCGFFGAVNFVAAWGLHGRTKWGWITTLILGAMYAPSGCLPLGALLMYGMLNENTRKNFGMA